MIDFQNVLATLSRSRRVFHSEADFQFALAWTLREMDPHLHIRLESHPEPAVSLDLLIADTSADMTWAVEMKYLTRLLTCDDAGERLQLKNHGAQDIRGYDVVKDLHRVERFVSGKPGWRGAVVVLTNDASYWRPRTHGRPTNADAFRIGEDVTLSGERAWGLHTGSGTMKGREATLGLAGSYRLRWSDFSRVDASPAGTFRSLVIEVSGT